MVEIVLISHGPLADALAETARMIVGEVRRIRPISLTPDAGPEHVAATLQALISDAPRQTQFLVLMDLFGGSPSTATAQVMAKDPRIEIVTGVNLPMLLEVMVSAGNRSLRELATLAQEKGKEGIIDVRRALQALD